MRYKVLIVDDEQEARNRLRLHLENFSVLQSIDSCKDGKQALAKIKELNPDIVFIDIEMPGMNGIEVLRNCGKPYPYFIFVTAYNQYAIEAFEQNAIDYILKPYAGERIVTALKKAVERLDKDRLAKTADDYRNLLLSFSDSLESSKNKEFVKRIAVKSVGKTSFINVDDIVSIEAADQYVEVETSTKKHTVRESMDHLEAILDPKKFFRVHRSFIINIDGVVGIENYDKNSSVVILQNHRKIRVSNSRKSDFKKWMGL
ncbi:MAG: LytTR family DNA-binding domain-containing protein [Bacteroidota bacterium]